MEVQEEGFMAVDGEGWVAVGGGIRSDIVVMVRNVLVHACFYGKKINSYQGTCLGPSNMRCGYLARGVMVIQVVLRLVYYMSKFAGQVCLFPMVAEVLIACCNSLANFPPWCI